MNKNRNKKVLTEKYNSDIIKKSSVSDEKNDL